MFLFVKSIQYECQEVECVLFMMHVIIRKLRYFRLLHEKRMYSKWICISKPGSRLNLPSASRSVRDKFGSESFLCKFQIRRFALHFDFRVHCNQIRADTALRSTIYASGTIQISQSGTVRFCLAIDPHT